MLAEPEAIVLPVRSCPGCGERMEEGYRQGPIPIYRHAVRCEIYGHQVEAENAARLAAARAALFTRQAELPPGCGTLQGYAARWTIDADNRTAVEECRRFAALCAAGALPRAGFTLYGSPGAGKTTLVAALAGTLVAAGGSLLFANVPEEMEGFKGRFREGGAEDRLGLLMRVRVLVLDDVGRERPGPWSVDQVLYPVINARIRAGIPTLCTTNETTAGLRQAYEVARGEYGERPRSGAAVVDRLREVCPWLPLRGESRRRPQVDF